MTRTDTHRPSAINPAEYEFVGYEYVKDDVWTSAHYREMIKHHMERTGGKHSCHDHAGNCGICGNVNAIYTVLFHHIPTNTYIRTGTDCAMKLDWSGNMDAFKRDAKRAMAAKAGKAKAKLVLAKAGIEAAWDVFESEVFDWEHNTVSSIVGKLVTYGSISEKQISFIKNLLVKITEKPAIEAAKKAIKDAADPVPVTDERIEITGEVLSTKYVDGYAFGSSVLKMLVMTPAGYKLWGTVPSIIDNVVKGDKVEFTAKVVPSNDDDKFGFFSRPNKASVV